jgi:SAM-dependent methyltransferase
VKSNAGTTVHRVSHAVRITPGSTDSPEEQVYAYKRMRENPRGMRKRLKFIYEEVEALIAKSGTRQIEVLDIGCGTGELVTIPLGSSGVNILGIDLHLPSIVRAITCNIHPNVRFACDSIDDLVENHFDVIICSEVLEHLEDPAEMLNSIKARLRRDGIGIITIPNGYGPKEMELRLYRGLYRLLSIFRLNRLSGWLRSVLISKYRAGLDKEGEGGEIKAGRDTLNNESPHVQFFALKRFRHLLDECGFSITKMENRRFLSGPFSGPILSISPKLCEWNVKVASILPHFLASSWMFVIKAKGSSGRNRTGIGTGIQANFV